ncbi:hypothetical protein [Avibacterium avium]|uniref:hypothetical protein n=1 Tax=Avibacterium avium TaxID=751 RepID=UPI003BF79442
MATTLAEVIEAFDNLFTEIHNHNFVKTLRFNEKTEKELLPLIRFYLLGYFNNLEAESHIEFEPEQSGRIDFIIDNVAVEFVAKTSKQANSVLSRNTNEKEIKKVMSYNGLSLIVLYNFTSAVSDEYVSKVLEEYRRLPATNNKEKYPFNVIYFYIDESEEASYQIINVRVN